MGVKYDRFKGIIMDRYFTHLYSYAHSSILTFCHFNPLLCLYYHTYAGWDDTAHPSDFLGRCIFFFFLLLAVRCVLNAKCPSPQQLGTPSPSPFVRRRDCIVLVWASPSNLNTNSIFATFLFLLKPSPFLLAPQLVPIYKEFFFLRAHKQASSAL